MNPHGGDMVKFLITCPAGFENFAIEELKRFGIFARRTFFKGVLIGESERNKDEVLKEIREKDTNYICKIYPVMRIRKVLNFEWVKEFIMKKSGMISGKRFLVICNRRGMHDFRSIDIEREIGIFVTKKIGAKVDYKNPEVLLIIDILQDIILISIVNRDEIVIKKPKVMRKHQERILNRSELKMKEIIEKYPFIFDKNKKVLDLGSAPGGWVKVLSGIVKEIVAVDPAELHESVKRLKNVKHLRIKAEDLEINDVFDVITNDINKFYDENLELTENIVKKYLKSGGYCIVTLKMRFPEEEDSLKKYVEEFLNRNGFKLIDLTRLKSNRINEYTLIFQRN